jgi:uncharacterized membrane protein YdjX (TVP38/TMEM64 family)
VFKFKRGMVWLTIACLVATALAVYGLGGIDPEQIQTWLRWAGVWAPLIYIALYVIATLLILPSTALNLAGGAIFGAWLGTLWTSIAAIVAAIVAFAFTRTVGREWISQRLAGRWQALDAEIHQGGIFYIFAIRLLPIIPYGLVNFAAGLTSVSFRDYAIGTTLGTVPGILPFVMLGSSGLKAMRTGEMLPLIGSFSLIALMVAGATWYRHHRRNPQVDLQEAENRQPPDHQPPK